MTARRRTSGAAARSARRSPAPRPPPAPAAASYPRALVARQLARVRALCRDLPDVSERPSHSAETFFVGKRVLAYFVDDHHGDGRLALWCPAPDGAQAMWIETDPDAYFRPPYVGFRGWVGVRLDRDLAWGQIAAVLEAAHQLLYRPPRGQAAAASPPPRRATRRR